MCDRKTKADKTVDALLDAAFRQLQHDTGPEDAEYRFQRDMAKMPSW